VDIGEAIVSEKAANFESAGLLRGGQQVWILMKVGGVMRVAGTDDTIDRFLLLHNSHDGSTLVRLCLTMKRIFCGNQLVNVEHAAEHRARARHTKNLMDKIAEIRDSLKLLPRFWAETQDKIDAMARIKLNTKALNIYLTDAVGVDPLADKGKTKANYDTLISAFETSPGNQVAGVKGSLWCAYNAVTYWLTHERTVRVTAGFQSEKEARLASLWGGTAEEANLRAWKAAQSYIF
jgi:phage/plasmid-like protein (TIGR03299 family)